MKRTSLQTEHAIVLQQIGGDGEDDFEYLAESLQFGPARLAVILQDLHHRGLVVTRRTYYGVWVRLSSRGKKLTHSLWPELMLQ